MKIFMGMHNIGSLMQDYAAGFRALGHEVFCVADSDVAIRNADVDLNIPRMTAAKLARLKQATQEDERRVRENFRELAWQKALEADICFFIWESFRPDASDLSELRKMGKKIVVRFCGSDVRDMEVDRQVAVRHGLPWTEYGMRNTLAALTPKLHYLRMCERYAHILIGASNMSLRPSLSGTSWLFQPDSTISNPSQRQHPVILHAPSSRATKGTNILLQIFDALRSAGLEFGVKLIENLPHEEMPQEYARADIFCNSLFYSGRARWEALAAGCVVADNCGYQAHLKRNRSYAPENLRGLGLPPSAEEWWWRSIDLEKFLSQSPIVEMTPETALEVLGSLILDWPRRQKLAQQAQDYVNLLSPRTACQRILDQLADPDSLEMRGRLLWWPFFNLEYSPEADEPERIALLNRYTDLVRPCRWYKDYVVPCERYGLRF